MFNSPKAGILKRSSLLEYKQFAAEWFRTLETKKAGNNIDRIDEIAEATDDEIIRRWLWRASIVGGPVAYLVVPFALSILQTFVWAPLMVILWTFAKIIMGVVFALFLFTVYFTFLRPEHGGFDK
ncbi:MAG: hypothetical protein IAF58_00380 [Leptolyngbya sp.]|nr:hypothetical protein [Candidatus Melainabacteria bacterium]